MKIKKFLAGAILASALLPASASAACTWCWGGHCWFISDASCNEVANTLEGGICFTGGPIMVNPNNDTIEHTGGSALLVQGGRRTPFAADGFSSSLKALNAKFPVSTDPKLIASRRHAQEELFRQAGRGTVSRNTVAVASRSLGLTVRGNQR